MAFDDVSRTQRDSADRQPTTPNFDVPLSRPETDAQRASIAAAQRHHDRAVDVMKDTRSADGVAADLLTKWQQINPAQTGPVR